MMQRGRRPVISSRALAYTIKTETLMDPLNIS